MIRLLSGPELADQWHKLKPLVEKALVHGGGVVTSHGLFLQCLGAVGQCWIREEDFARFNDCKRTVVYGRKGWARALKQYGYNEPFITLTKEV